MIVRIYRLKWSIVRENSHLTGNTGRGRRTRCRRQIYEVNLKRLMADEENHRILFGRGTMIDGLTRRKPYEQVAVLPTARATLRIRRCLDL